MNEEEIITTLESKYILVKKGKWWSFLGGAFAFLIIAGVISYKASLSVIEGHAAKTATDEIKKLKNKAKINVASLNALVEKGQDMLKDYASIGTIDTLEVKGSWPSNKTHTLKDNKKFTNYRNIIVCSKNGDGYTKSCRLIDSNFNGYTNMDFNGMQKYETKFKIIGDNQYEFSGNKGRRYKDNKLYLIQGLHKKAP